MDLHAIGENWHEINITVRFLAYGYAYNISLRFQTFRFIHAPSLNMAAATGEHLLPNFWVLRPPNSWILTERTSPWRR